MLDLKLDCRHFRGDKPCRHHCVCDGCAHYDPMGTRILVVKLDAIGDVARTTTLLRPLRERYAPCHVTWLVAPSGLELVSGHPLVEVALPYEAASLERLRVERFDLVLSLDKTPRACSAAMSVRAITKLGFGLSEFGTVFPLDEKAEYAFRLGLDDELKFRLNQRTYQDVIFEVCWLTYTGEEYELPLTPEDRAFARAFAVGAGLGAGAPIIGLNMGGGAMFAHKMWDAPEATAFVRMMMQRRPCKVLLFGAERERAKIEAVLQNSDGGVFSAGLGNSLKQFQALVGLCSVLVGGDSLGMHMALAERVPQVVLFGPTCAQEIDLYGRGEKIVSPLGCCPCYRPSCGRSPSCMQAIAPEKVVDAVERALGIGGKG